MWKRYPCQAVILFVFGILTAKGIADGVLLLSMAAAAAAMAATGIGMYMEPFGKKKLRQAVILILAFLAGAIRMHTVHEKMEHWTAGVSDGQKTVLQGRIIKKQATQTQQGSMLWAVRMTDSYCNGPQGVRPCGNIILYTDLKSGEPVIGNTIVISGTIQFFKQARNDGNFDEYAYYRNQGYTFKVYGDRHAYKVVGRNTDRLRECLYELRQRLVELYRSHMPPEEAGALCAMLTGETSALSEEIRQLYRQSGIAHILAVSGLHISIIGAAVFRLLRSRQISYLLSSAAAMGLLLLFGMLTGNSLSAVRAIVMFGIYLGAACCGRVYDSMNGLAVAAACLLMQNPVVLFLAGFQLSFTAVAGVLLGKELCQIYEPKYRLAETVLISLSLQMLTLPLIAWYYFEFPVYAMLLNLLVLPFMGAVLVCGLAGGIFGLAMSGGVVCKAFLSGCTLLLRYFSKAGGWFLRLPGAVYVTGQPDIWQMVGYYAVLAVSVFLAVTYHECKSKRIVGPGFAVCMMLLLVPKPVRTEAVFLDVGQGDGILIRTGDGKDIMIDGGSTDVRQVGTNRILPFLKSQAIARIDDWFLSHLDQDHMSGLLEIVRTGYPIGEVVLADGVVRDEAYETLIRQLSEYEIKVRYLAKGDVLRGRRSGFRCLAPASGRRLHDRNAQSLVLLYEDRGYRGLFSGDISKKEERELLAEFSGKPVTLYKAAHHGSDGSNAQELMTELKPLVSVVSCAVENSYGHPGEEAVAAIETHSGTTKYTMRSGQIRVVFGRKKISVHTKLF